MLINVDSWYVVIVWMLLVLKVISIVSTCHLKMILEDYILPLCSQQACTVTRGHSMNFNN